MGKIIDATDLQKVIENTFTWVNEGLTNTLRAASGATNSEYVITSKHDAYPIHANVMDDVGIWTRHGDILACAPSFGGYQIYLYIRGTTEVEFIRALQVAAVMEG